MAPRLAIFLALLPACGPEKADTGGETLATSTTSTSDGETTGSESSSGTPTGESSGAPYEPPFCAWDEPGNESFCPLLTMANADVAGDTPFGPVAFKYAYFGLFLCDVCPQPYWPAIGLFAEAQQPGLEPRIGDRVIFDYRASAPWTHGAWMFEMWIGDEKVAADVSATNVVLPTEQQTMPPLDLDDPPTVTGDVSIMGEGWTLQGSFTATLCTGLDWTPPCD